LNIVGLLVASTLALTPAAPARPTKNASASTAGAAMSSSARLDMAIEDYRALRLEKVIDVVEDLLFDGTLDDATRARALYLLGLAYAQQGESATARQRLIDACTLDPAVDLDVPLPKKVKSLVDGARQAASRGTGSAASPGSPPDEGSSSSSTAAGGSGSPTSPSSTAPAAPAPTRSNAGPWPWVVTLAGGVFVAAGGVAGGWGALLAAQSADAKTTQRSAVALADTANAALTVAGSAAALGAVLVGVGVGWFALGDDEPVPAARSPDSGGPER
jgi:hypothetical protein